MKTAAAALSFGSDFCSGGLQAGAFEFAIPQLPVQREGRGFNPAASALPSVGL
jgi:hypothetical protein